MSKQEIKYKECNGCKSYKGYKGKCFLVPYYFNEQGNKLECPCSTCLVKGICEKPCDEFNLYIDNTYNKRNERVL